MNYTTDYRTGSYLDVLKKLEPAIKALSFEELEHRFPVVAKIEPDHDCHTQLEVFFRLPNQQRGRVVIWADDPWPDATSLQVSFSTTWDPTFRVYFKLSDDSPIGCQAALDKIVDLIIQFVVTGVCPEGTVGLEPSQVFCIELTNHDNGKNMKIPSVGIDYDKQGQPQPMLLRDVP